MPEAALAEAKSDMDKFASQFEDTPPAPATASSPAPTLAPQPSPAAAAPPATPAEPPPPASVTPPDFWAETDNDPELPPSLRGKTRREIWDRNKSAVQESNRAGLEKNDAERRAQIAEAALSVLLRQQQPSAPPPAKEQTPYDQFGLQTPEDAYTNLPQIVSRIPGVIDQRTQGAIAPLAQQLGAMQNQVTFMQAEQARGAARGTIDEPTWEALKLPLASIMQANNMDPRRAESWTAATEAYRKHAAAMIPQTVDTKVTAPPAGNGKPGPAVAPGTQKKAATTGDPRMDTMLREYLTSFNTKGVKVDFDAVVDSIKGDPNRRAEAE